MDLILQNMKLNFTYLLSILSLLINIVNFMCNVIQSLFEFINSILEKFSHEMNGIIT